MKDKLYIIGNGFDLHHKLRSSYNDYLNWLLFHHKDIYDTFLEYYPNAGENIWWNDFEYNLGFPDRLELKTLIEECNVWPQTSKDDMNKMVNNYIAPNNSGHIPFRRYMTEMCIGSSRAANDIHIKLEYLINAIKKSFIEWISNMGTANMSMALNLELSNAIFLNFNYTKTLQHVYKVHEGDIVYIHGCVDSESSIIFGHGESDESIKRIIDPTDIRSGNAVLGIANAYQITLFDFCYLLRKDVKEIIMRNQPFFDSLQRIKQVFIFGHSLSDIDKPYFDIIIDKIKNNAASFIISYYSTNDYYKVKQFVANYGIKEYCLVKLEDLMIQETAEH